MTGMRRPLPLLPGALLAGLLLVGACGTGTGGAGTGSPSPMLGQTPVTAPPASPGTPIPGQTDTEWGRIWDTVPTGFPTYPGSTPSGEAATGPASATLVADGDVAKDVTTWMSEHLTAAGYAVDGATTPLEDGSYVVEVTGSAGCRVQVTVAPLGSLTTITILYGASCPNT